VEQSYKQIKHGLGRSDNQLRSDVATRRHRELVFCAFTFCWWAYGRLPIDESAETEKNDPLPGSEGKGKRRRLRVSWPQALRAVRGCLEPWIMLRRNWRVFSGMPLPLELKALLE
jgi:hypothetical protein